MSALACFVGVSRDRFVGVELQVTFNRETEFAADGAKLREAQVAELAAAHAEIAKTEGEIGTFVDFREEPGALGVGGEKLHDGLEVERMGEPLAGERRHMEVAGGSQRSRDSEASRRDRCVSTKAGLQIVTVNF